VSMGQRRLHSPVPNLPRLIHMLPRRRRRNILCNNLGGMLATFYITI